MSVRDAWNGATCPECDDDSRIDVYATVAVRLVPDGTDADLSADGSHIWGSDSKAVCAGCGYQGPMKDFAPDD